MSIKKVAGYTKQSPSTVIKFDLINRWFKHVRADSGIQYPHHNLLVWVLDFLSSINIVEYSVPQRKRSNHNIGILACFVSCCFVNESLYIVTLYPFGDGSLVYVVGRAIINANFTPLTSKHLNFIHLFR